MSIDLSSFPTKGTKREEAIYALASDRKNAETLFYLANNEKGNCKKAALKTLAQIEYEPALPIWKKLLKSKNKGEQYFIKSTVDSISELIANEFYNFLVKILDQPKGYMLTLNEASLMKTYISLMLGKASPKMLDVYRLVADNADQITSLNFDEKESLWINDYLRFFEVDKKDKAKIFPAVLSISILRTHDIRLIALAEELYQQYKTNWLSPVFMTALLTKSAKTVYADFSIFLKDKEQSAYLYDVLGTVYFDPETEKHIGLIFWGQYTYGETDTRFVEQFPLHENLDSNWFTDLMKIGLNNPPRVTLQAYNRGDVLYDSFDEMLVEIVPYTTTNTVLKQQLIDYFNTQEQKSNDQNLLYIDILNKLKFHVNESAIIKYLNCKKSAASIYNLVSVLKSSIWTEDEQLDFFNKLATEKYKNRDQKTIEACRESLLKK